MMKNLSKHCIFKTLPIWIDYFLDKTSNPRKIGNKKILDQCIPQRSSQCQNRISKQVFHTWTNETSIAFISLKAKINKISLIWRNSALWFCYFKRCWNYAGETVSCILKIFSKESVLWDYLFSVRIFGLLTKNIHLSSSFIYLSLDGVILWSTCSRQHSSEFGAT